MKELEEWKKKKMSEDIEELRELKALLLKVPDWYDDFVIGMLSEAKESEYRKNGLTEYIKNNPEATSSDIIKYLEKDLGAYDEYRKKRLNEEFEELNELKSLLQNVPGRDDDFMLGVLIHAKKSEYRKTALTEYIEKNPKATSDDIEKYLMDDLGLYEEQMRKVKEKKSPA